MSPRPGTKIIDAPVSTKAVASARSVVVMCKIPNGLKLQLQKTVKRPVAGRDGLEMLEFHEFTGRPYFVRGPAYPVAPPKGYPRQPVTEGGYAATPGIPKDFWDQWWEQNKMADYCRPQDGADKGMIYAEVDLDSAVAAALEHADTRSGLEPLSTDTDKNGKLIDPRAPRPISGMSMLAPEPHPNDGPSSINLPA
jgi:hypothetical protein